MLVTFFRYLFHRYEAAYPAVIPLPVPRKSMRDAHMESMGSHASKRELV